MFGYQFGGIFFFEAAFFYDIVIVRIKYELLFLTGLLFTFFACHETGKTLIPETELIEYPVPFYELKPGAPPAFYYGIRTERFFYVEDSKGAWLLYDKNIDTGFKINLVGLDEYAFIQSDLARQLQELLLMYNYCYFPGKEEWQNWISPGK